MAELVFSDHETMFIKGELNFFTVRQLWEQSKKKLKGLKALRIDLSEVTHCDSAGLALLLEWQRFAKQHQQTLTFQHLPKQLQNIAKVSNLSEMIK